MNVYQTPNLVHSPQLYRIYDIGNSSIGVVVAAFDINLSFLQFLVQN